MGSRSVEKAENAIAKLQQECPESENTVEAVQVDLTSDDSIQAAFDKISSSPGHIDTLINNAG
jgi:NAD(P)-dependent dehydrogenase (short-subunit alcohol dehydrogenase family)